MTAKCKAGQMIDGYQLQSPAPLDFTRGAGRHHVAPYDDDGHTAGVTGAWSDPWWAYCPDRGWAVVKTWNSKPQTSIDWDRRNPDHPHRWLSVEVPAFTERTVTAYDLAA